MTEALDRLIEAVEAVELPRPLPFPIYRAAHIIGAYHGSMDDALALHESLLPGWEWARLNDRMAVEHGGSVYSDRSACPARAWLLAILKAYRAQIGGEG